MKNSYITISCVLSTWKKDINLLCRRCINSNETVEHLLCECESLTTSQGRIFGQSFGEVQQLSHVPVDLFRRFATEIGLVGSNRWGSTIDRSALGSNDHPIKTYNLYHMQKKV